MKQLLEIPDLTVLTDEPLSRHGSYRIGGPAEYLIIPETIEALENALKTIRHGKMRCLIIGSGSNILFPDKGFKGVVIKLGPTASFLHFLKLQSLKVRTFISSGAATLKSELIDFSIENEFSGFEFLAGIPGTLGGGMRMNAGTFDGHFSDIVKTFETISPDGTRKTYRNSEGLFSYRKLAIPEDEIITEILFYTKKGAGAQIKEKVDKITSLRKNKHPLNFPCCGCVFKNPPFAPAGLLIEKNGLKGYTVGGACVSELHGNFIVNVGNATAHDVKTVIERVKAVILEREKIRLEEEIIILEEPPE